MLSIPDIDKDFSIENCTIIEKLCKEFYEILNYFKHIQLLCTYAKYILERAHYLGQNSCF